MHALFATGRLANTYYCETWEVVDDFPLKERILQLLSATSAFLNKVVAISFLYDFLEGEV